MSEPRLFLGWYTETCPGYGRQAEPFEYFLSLANLIPLKTFAAHPKSRLRQKFVQPPQTTSFPNSWLGDIREKWQCLLVWY